MAELRPERADSCAGLIHIGYHKAGSTWLQQVLFSDPALAFNLPFERNDVNERIVAPKQLGFDAERTRAFFDAALPPEAGGMPVLSNERLSGNPHSGGWDSCIVADRLASLFPRARILIVIREQRSAIRAAYLQYVREGGAETLARYLSPPKAGRFRRPLFDFDFFAYHALIDCYQNRFGQNQVLVLPYELLATDPIDFASRICSFAGVSPPSTLPDRHPNIGLSPLAASLKRRLNRWFVRDTLNPNPRFPLEHANQRLRSAAETLDPHLPAALKTRQEDSSRRHIAAATATRYKESNRRTSELTNLNLTQHGYET